ncbi:MAG: threonine/serine dehydratase [Acidobacteriota bacterium]|nr:threonine/serine dehydratase [Acidobacteriota bacterium]
MITLDDLRAAATRLHGVAVHTPLVRYFGAELSQSVPTGEEEFYFKPESLQPIGSFKLRGAYNKIASLPETERARGVISYSSGNHAQGVAWAARRLGIKAVIVMPSGAPRVKRDATAALGAEIVTVGNASDERRDKALELAAQHGYVVIPPYDDEAIIAGQGTVGLEIAADLPSVELVLVPIGGGGLSSGVAAAIKLSGLGARVIGVEPALANDAAQSLKAGRIVRIPGADASRTVADGLRTQSIGQHNFQHLAQYLDGVVTVSEDEIRRAMREILTTARLMTEPSGAVATAAWLYHRQELGASRRTVAVISGGNADPHLAAAILEDRIVTEG